MKKLFLLLAVALLAFSCTKKQGQLVPVHVQVNDFEVSQGDIDSRDDPQSIANYNDIKEVTLAFYNSDGSEQCKIIQQRADASTYSGTFGEFDLSLPMGSYTMVVLAYGTITGCAVTLTNPTTAVFTGEHALETFAATQAVSITNTNAVTLSATLNRIVSKLKVVSTDGKTANASNVRITLTGGSRSFNPTTGLATDNNGFINTVGISVAVGATSTSITYLFLATDEETMDITIDVLDSNGTSISHKFVQNVPFKRNRQTILSGSLYNSSSNTDFEVNTTWLEDYNGGF